MPVFEITAPDGKKLRVNAPEGATQEQALAKAREMYQPQQAPKQAPQPQGYISEDPTARQYARTAFDNVMQGSTLGFADEITDRLGAAGASLMTDQSYGDLLKEARRTTKDRQAEQLSEMPVTTIGSQLAGALLTGKAAGGTKAGQAFARGTGKAADKVGGLLRRGKVGRNAIQDMLTATPASAGYAVGTAQDGERFTGDTLRDTALGVGTAGVASAVTSKVLPKLSRTKTPPATSENLRKVASQQYDEAARLGGTIKPEYLDDIVDNIDGLKKQTKAGAIFQGDDVLSDVTARLKAVRDSGEPITLQAFQEIDESIGDLVSREFASQDFKSMGKLMDVQTILREAVEGADTNMVSGGNQGFQALKNARKTWSQLRKMEDIERIISRAKDMQQPAQGIKSGFRTLKNNPKRMRGFTEDERKAIEKAAETGMWQDIFQTFGSRLGPLIAASTGGADAGAAAGLASIASRGVGSAMQGNKATNVVNTVANMGRTPQKQIGPSLTDLLMAPK